jgi:putative ABC transport system permease protein
LLPEDENALVIGNALVKLRPDLKVGDEVTLKINRRKYPFVIIGIFRMAGMTINPYVYANYDYLSRITHQPDQYANLRIVTEPHDAGTQEKVVKELEAMFDKEGIRVQELSTRAQIEASNQNSVLVIILFLLIMAMLIAVVGGLGLMGTMSMNVIERTREIGVMRAVGAN